MTLIMNNGFNTSLPGLVPAIVETMQERKGYDFAQKLLIPFGADVAKNAVENNIEFTAKALDVAADAALLQPKSFAGAVKDTIDQRKEYGLMKKLFKPAGADFALNYIKNLTANLTGKNTLAKIDNENSLTAINDVLNGTNSNRNPYFTFL